MQEQIDSKTIKALALDLDGTVLMPGAALGDRTLRCLKELMDRGIELIICTGRAIEGAEQFRAAIGTEGPMVYFNGAEVVDMPGRKILSASFLGLDVVDVCIDIARAEGFHYQIFLPASGSGSGKEALIIDKQSPESEMYRSHTGIEPEVKDLKKAIAEPGLKGCIKSMFITDPVHHEGIRSKLIERFGSSVYIAQTYPTFLEVMNAGVSKAEGLKIAMQHRGIKAEQVIALGDEENDLPMFSVAAFFAAPANAKEKVRLAADRVFASNAEEGAAAFLEELFGL